MFEMLCINTSRTIYYIDIYSIPFLGVQVFLENDSIYFTAEVFLNLLIK